MCNLELTSGCMRSVIVGKQHNSFKGYLLGTVKTNKYTSHEGLGCRKINPVLRHFGEFCTLRHLLLFKLMLKKLVSYERCKFFNYKIGIKIEYFHDFVLSWNIIKLRNKSWK